MQRYIAVIVIKKVYLIRQGKTNGESKTKILSTTFM